MRVSFPEPGRGHVDLDTKGSIEDIARLGIVLQEGMRLPVYSDASETEDLVAEGTVGFDKERATWFVSIDWKQIQTVPVSTALPG
jgi:hypothetical protein